MSLLVSLQTWLGQCAAKTLRREHPLIIAVTGSVGKSTTKQAIGAILQADVPGNAVRVPENSYNNELGLPLTVFGHAAPGRSPFKWLALLGDAWATSLGLKKTGVRIFVLEMGADKAGDIAKLVKIAPPDVSVVTAITPEDAIVPVHAGNYASIDALVEEKSQIIKSLKPDGYAILNADDPKVFSMRHLTNERVFTFGENEAADVRIHSKHIEVEETPHGNMPIGLRVVIELYHRRYDIVLAGVYGTSVAYSVGAAATVAYALDTLPEPLIEFAKHFKPVNGRTRLIPGIKHTMLLDDSYNASPASVIQSLKDLASIETKPGQRKIACIGEMRELGDKSEEMHRRVGAEAAKAGIDVLVCCGIFGRAMEQGALANGLKQENVHFIEDTPEAGRFIQELIQPGDLILAKASQGKLETKGVRMERVIKELMADPARADELLVRQGAAWQRK